MHSKNLNAIIIDENFSTAQQIKMLIEEQCPKININDISINPHETKEIINNAIFDVIIMSLKTGKDFAFDILKTSSVDMHNKELILVSSNADGSLPETKDSYTSTPLESNANNVTTTLKTSNSLDEEEEEFQEKFIVSQKQVAPLNVLAIPSADEVSILKISDILYLKSEGKYTTFYSHTGKNIVSSTNLGEYEKKLIHNNFFRAHNSYLVNMDNLTSVQKRDGVYIEMANRDMIPVSKRKKDALFQSLGIR